MGRDMRRGGREHKLGPGARWAGSEMGSRREEFAATDRSNESIV